MPDEGTEKKDKTRRKRAPGAVRYFEEPQIRISRMGREVLVYRGAFGTLDLNKGRVDLTDAIFERDGMEVSTKTLRVDLAGNRLTAKNGVKITEGGVTLTADGVEARPSLGDLAFKGKVKIHAKDKETAESLLKSPLL